MARLVANLVGGVAIMGLSIIALLPERILLVAARGWGRVEIGRAHV